LDLKVLVLELSLGLEHLSLDIIVIQKQA